MRFVGRHDEHLALPYRGGIAGYRDFSYPVKHTDQGIKRCGVFAQSLALVEGKQGNRPSFLSDQYLTHHGTPLVSDEIDQITCRVPVVHVSSLFLRTAAKYYPLWQDEKRASARFKADAVYGDKVTVG